MSTIALGQSAQARAREIHTHAAEAESNEECIAELLHMGLRPDGARMARQVTA